MPELRALGEWALPSVRNTDALSFTRILWLISLRSVRPSAHLSIVSWAEWTKHCIDWIPVVLVVLSFLRLNVGMLNEWALCTVWNVDSGSFRVLIRSWWLRIVGPGVMLSVVVVSSLHSQGRDGVTRQESHDGDANGKFVQHFVII